MSSRRQVLLLTGAVLGAPICASQPAHAYIWEDVGPCSGGWSVSGSGYRDQSIFPMCYLTTNFAVPPGCSGMQRTDLSSAATTAYTRWKEDGWSQMRLSFNAGFCWGDVDGNTTSNGSWWDNGDEHSAIWWDVSSAYVRPLPSIGVEGTDHAACFPPFDLDASIIASDIDVRIDACYQNEACNTRTLCQTGFSVEDVLLHEIGHNYAVEHNDAWLTTMNSILGTRACADQDNYHPQPWGDEFHALMDHYGWSDWQNGKDIAASHMWGTLSNRVADTGTRSICASLGTSPQNFSWTFTNQIGPLTSGFQYRFEVRRDSVPGVTYWTSPTYAVSSSATFPGATYQINSGIAIPTSVLVAGVTYRLWLVLDPNRLITEQHELDSRPSDNWVPFQFLMQKTTSC